MGEQLARKLASTGCRVALVARRADRIHQIAIDINGATLNLAVPYVADVLDYQNAANHFDEVVQQLGGLDLIIYSSGIMPVIGPTEYNTEKDALIVQTNLIGAMAWLNPAAKRFERAKAGTMVGIGSVAGDRGRKGNPAYAASKAGLECYLESLRNRLGPLGVNVVTVKPGPIETEMTQHLGRRRMLPAHKAADIILRAAKKNCRTAYVPWYLGPVMSLIKAIPSPIFRRLKI